MEILQAVFYVVVIGAVTIVTILSAVAVFFMIRILRALHDITERVQRGSAVLAEDAAHLRSQIRTGNAVAALVSVVARAAGFSKGSKKKKPVEEDRGKNGTESEEAIN